MYLGGGKKKPSASAARSKKEEAKEKAKEKAIEREEKMEKRQAASTEKRMKRLSASASGAVSAVKKRSSSSRIRSVKAKVIGDFFRKTRRRRIEVFLKSVCNDSGVCMAFGKESDKIKEYFDGFISFEHVDEVKRIGQESNNGFVNSIQYEKNGYVSYCVLKSSRDDELDNLMYEYLVGQYINKMCRIFPCFLETYGLYKYNSVAAWRKLIGNGNNKNTLKNSLTLLNEAGLAVGCYYSKYISILIQNVAKAHSVYDYLMNENVQDATIFFKYDLLPILFQIYCPLAFMKNNFTHYDLHLDNILLYSAKPNHYFLCHYHLPDSTEEEPHIISFKTKSIAKIIDYGRSYFRDNAESNSRAIRKALCDTPLCDPDCGQDVGFHWLKESSHYINSTKRNMSHDLTALYKIKKCIKNEYQHINTGLHNLLHSIEYEGEFGTPEVEGTSTDNVIRNVDDAYVKISELIQSEDQMVLNSRRFIDRIKQGDLHVYCDGSRKMRYEPYIDPAVKEAKAAEKEAIKAQRIAERETAKASTASTVSTATKASTAIP